MLPGSLWLKADGKTHANLLSHTWHPVFSNLGTLALPVPMSVKILLSSPIVTSLVKKICLLLLLFLLFDRKQCYFFLTSRYACFDNLLVWLNTCLKLEPFLFLFIFLRVYMHVSNKINSVLACLTSKCYFFVTMVCTWINYMYFVLH
jgi:hypothetical protein